MLKSNRESKYLRDHVNHRSKFCFNINWINNSRLNILICGVLQNRIKHGVRPSLDF